MASSNRHWPSLFKSKTCNSHHQWQQHDINSPSLLSAACQQKPPHSAPSCEERTPEPKPRWNPKPDQIRILEAIFNSGMVNPPRDEIRKIRIQLQEYGQVGDANVFYWFQNRKSRSKHKQRLSTKSRSSAAAVANSCAAASPSSSSSERSTSAGSADKANLQPASKTLAAAATLADVSNSATVQNCCFHSAPGDQFSGEPFFFPAPPAVGYCLATTDLTSLVGAPEQGLGLCSGIWGDLLSTTTTTTTTTGEGCKSDDQAVAAAAKAKMQLHYICGTAATATEHAAAEAATASAITTAAPTIASPVGDILLQGIGGASAAAASGGGGLPAARSAVVFINEVAFQVGPGLFNVKEAFGEEAVLLHSSGQPVLVDEWGITLLPLQHGASYYLV